MAWARQHYHGVTYHTRRVLSAWVTRIPYEMTDGVIENMAEEVLGTHVEVGLQTSALAVRVHPRARRARRGDHRGDTERRRHGQQQLPLQSRKPAAVVRAHVRRHPWHREPDPARVHQGRRRIQDALHRRAAVPTTTRFHTIHIYVDEDHGGHVGEFAEQLPRHRRQAPGSARAAYFAGAELTRRCWDAIDGSGLVTTEYTTVRKAMAVVSAFSYGEPVLGVSELARRLGIGKSTVHRILTTLVADGYVERTHDERYRLSIKMYEIGQQVAASIELRELVHPALERLRNESGETAHVGVLSGTDVVYVDRLESPHMIRWLTASGGAGGPTPPRRGSAFSRSALLPTSRSRGRWPSQARPAHDHLSLDAGTSPREDPSRRVCRECRRGGTRGRLRSRLPSSTARGDCIAAMSVAGPVSRMPPEKVEHVVRLVVRAAASVGPGRDARSA